jgi:hypothetical protein
MLEAYRGNPIYFNTLHRRNFTKPDKLNIKYIMVMITEYEKAIEFLKVGCGCGCSSKVPKEVFAEMCEAFQALSKSEQDIFLMAQLKAMDGGSISASCRLKKKARINKRTLYC